MTRRADPFRQPMRKLLAVLLLATTAAANEQTYRSMQSGSATGGTPLYDRGIHGEGQIVAVLDTGLDLQNCYFAEPNGTLPPINTRVDSYAVDPSRRKVIAYNFLYSCEAFPNAPYCDDPAKGAGAFDNHGHGTRAAASAVGDKGAPIVHDFGDAIATGAKLIVQDGGLSPVDQCTSRPGFGCPVNITPILNQAYRQGARIHSNSWGDRQGMGSAPPTANYPASARDVDAFVHSHPDMLVIFNTGNFSGTPPAPASTLSAPGTAKNALQAGGTRGTSLVSDDVLTEFTLNGPTRDGRIKPDVVAPAVVFATDASIRAGGDPCVARSDAGTSWSAPSLAGAAALVRQYYTEGFYPSGARTSRDAITPSAALMKATIIASTRGITERANGGYVTRIPGPPSYQQGFGFPVLDDALFFAGDRTELRIIDTPTGLAQGEAATLKFKTTAGTRLRAVLVWTDPAGVASGPTDSTPQLVNDLDLRIVAPTGVTSFGNEALHPGQPDRLNNVESITIDAASSGEYTISVSANRLRSGLRQGYALVIIGEFENDALTKRRAIRR